MGKKSLQQSLFYACVVRDLLWRGLEAGCGGWLLSAVSIFAWCCAVVATILNICQSAALPNTLPHHTPCLEDHRLSRKPSWQSRTDPGSNHPTAGSSDQSAIQSSKGLAVLQRRKYIKVEERKWNHHSCALHKTIYVAVSIM